MGGSDPVRSFPIAVRLADNKFKKGLGVAKSTSGRTQIGEDARGNTYWEVKRMTYNQQLLGRVVVPASGEVWITDTHPTFFSTCSPLPTAFSMDWWRGESDCAQTLYPCDASPGPS